MTHNDLLHLGVHQLFKDAAIIIKERGLAKGVTYDPKTCSPDIYGAILMAAGAKPRRLCSGSVHPAEVGIPNYRHIQIEAAFSLLEETVGNVDEWNDTASVEDAASLLLRCCDIAMSEKRG